MNVPSHRSVRKNMNFISPSGSSCKADSSFFEMEHVLELHRVRKKNKCLYKPVIRHMFRLIV